MATLIIPKSDGRDWPTLGDEIIQFVHDRVVFGPGDRAGEPYEVSGDFEAMILWAYEVYPKGHDLAGRRRYGEVVEDVRKGVGKTEHAAVLAICESHPECPVRFDGWRGQVPVGRPMRDPYIPMLAYTEEQSEDLAYAALRRMISESDLVDDYDVGLDRILVLDGGREAGKIAALAAAPNSRDGARTTWQHLDETHRMYSPRLKAAWETMRANVPKRRAADAWTFKTTTAPEAGQGSIAEDDRRVAEDVIEGRRKAPARLFYFRRECSPERAAELPDVDDDTPQARSAVRDMLVEASGPAASWSADLDAIVGQFFDPRVDRAYLCRVWLNWMREGGTSAFDVTRFRDLMEPRVKPGAFVVASFDGSVGGAGVPDATGLLVTEVTSGVQTVVGCWEKPVDADDDWEVPRGEVDEAVATMFSTWDVWRLYADPHKWGTRLDEWAGEFGAQRVVKWDTSKWSRMAWACREYAAAIRLGQVHPSDELLVAHVGNAKRRPVPIWIDDTGEQLWVVQKESQKTVRKIDLAVCGILGRRGQLDAVAAGAKPTVKRKAKVHSF
jgi:hypothetical protein